MIDVDSRPPVSTPPDLADPRIDETLIDLMLEQSISDRLRTVCRYVNALARFRPV